jgi:predicted aldo/keto reductase-like oxidoreductase
MNWKESPFIRRCAMAKSKGCDLNRRDFLKWSSAALAGLAVGARGAAAEEAGGMLYRDLGKTGLKVSEIGMGTVTAAQPVAIQHAMEKGITLFHTCLRYGGGRSIEAFGQVLKDMKSKRDKIVLALKGVEDFDKALQAMNTDYVDIYLPPMDVKALESGSQQETIEKLKKSGKARFCGLVTHKDMKNIIEAALKVKYIEVILSTYSVACKAELDPVIQKVKAAGIGFIAMKTRQGVPKGQDPAPAIKGLLENKDVDSILITQASVQDVDKAVALSGKKLTIRERREARRLMLAASACGSCGRCEGVCPKGLAIADIFRFHMYATRYEAPQQEVGLAEYRSLGPTGQATTCDDCGACERVCPNAVSIRERLKEAHTVLA